MSSPIRPLHAPHPSTETAKTIVTTSPSDVDTDSTHGHVESEPTTRVSSPDVSPKPLPLTLRRTLWIVIALVTNLFLATTDSTIVSTSLPTITHDLNAAESEYAWVGVAYLLCQTMMQPVYGQLADGLGRKAVLFTSVGIFLVGSILCGAAQNMMWLIIARGVSGIGGGGIVNSVWVIITEIVPPKDKAKWSQALSCTWCMSAIAGPVLGGVFSNEVIPGLNWRWAFYINVPIGLLSAGSLAFLLRSVQAGRTDREVSLKELAGRFDYGGLILLMGGTTCLVLGFSFASSSSWQSPVPLCLISSGLVGLVAGGFYENWRKRDCLLPSGLFMQATPVLILIIAILHNFAFTAGTFYLPVFYQAVHGSSPLEAGMRVLPYSLGSSLASIPTAWFISYNDGPVWKARRLWIAIIVGIAASVLGFGLMITLDQHSSLAVQEVYPLIAGIGIGMLFHTPFQVVTNCLPDDIASATSAFFMLRFIGTTTGLSVAAAIFDSQIRSSLPSAYTNQISGATIDLRAIIHIEPFHLREAVLEAVSTSISKVWIACTPCLALALLLSLTLRIRPEVVQAQTLDLVPKPSLDDPEKATRLPSAD